MKVALVHDYLKEYGGAERVLEALHDIYPDATVFTSVYLPEYLGPHKERFRDWKIKTSWLQHLPFNAKLISPMRLLAPLAFKSFDFKGYDVVIVSATGAYFPNTLQKKNAVHICYCHTPPRYLYGYATAREWKKNKVMNAVGEIMNHFLRLVDFRSAQNVDYFIANSEEVASRIKKFYRKEATVIYPPVAIPKAQFPKKEEYYVAGGRLARPKHIDLIVSTATERKLRLKVFGKAFAGYGEELEKLAGPTVEFVGEVSDEEKYDLLAKAKGYIFASEDEDFGILPVEAMAQGTAVIAYKSGGVQETVINKKTGLFFDELSVKSLTEALNEFEKMKFDPADCRKRAEEFSKEKFQKKIRELVDQAVRGR